MNRDEMLKKLTALDFYLIDMNLYLNTHPRDAEALNIYNTLAKEARELREEYERMYGMLTANSPTGKGQWQWIDNPWPWQYGFNFDLAGENG